MDNKRIGKLGENTAAEYLKGDGYQILCRNFRCRAGEIDIIAMKGYNLAFVEVKTRRTNIYGTPGESVTPFKQSHLKTAAQYYLSSKPKGGIRPQNLQFDVIEIVINHICDAF
ncbi:MAG: YraN family protein [Anaerovoracaceae bacterium]